PAAAPRMRPAVARPAARRAAGHRNDAAGRPVRAAPLPRAAAQGLADRDGQGVARLRTRAPPAAAPLAAQHAVVPAAPVVRTRAGADAARADRGGARPRRRLTAPAEAAGAARVVRSRYRTLRA